MRKEQNKWKHENKVSKTVPERSVQMAFRL